MQLRVYASQDIGQRANQEDAFLMNCEHSLFAVADGLGGHQAGEVASKMAVDILDAEVRNGSPLEAGLHSANSKIFAAAQSDRSLHRMGTTLTALQLVRDRFIWVHAGDSRLYRLREHELLLLTTDHTYFDQQWKLYNSLGAQDSVTAETSNDLNSDLKAGDLFLLCTDGLNVLSIQEMRGTLEFYGGQIAVDRLVQMALDAGGRDNITVVTVEVLSL